MRRFRASSVTPAAVIRAQSLVSLVAGIVATAIILVAARPAYTYYSPRSLPGVVIGLLIGMIRLLSVGVLIASLFRSTRTAQGAGLIAFFPVAVVAAAGSLASAPARRDMNAAQVRPALRLAWSP